MLKLSSDISKVLSEKDCYTKIKDILRLLDMQLLIGLVVPQTDSTSGYCVLFGGNLTFWRSKRQSVVACSSAEAEYRSMAPCELIWSKELVS